MGDGGDDAQADAATHRQRARGERARGEANETAHAKGSERLPTIPPEGDLEDDGRQTEKMSASHFRAMLAAHLPAPLRDFPAPVEHEEVASSRLMAEALSQLRASGPLRLKSESDDDNGDEIVARLRPAPSTLPISTQRLVEIRATADTRPAIAMAPLKRPPEPFARATIEIPLGRRSTPRIETARVAKGPDAWTLVALCVLIVAAFATVALLLSR